MRVFFQTDNRGSYTVEAAIVFSAIILALSCLILSFMFMYHKLLLTRTASWAAQSAAAKWTQGEDLYYHITKEPLGNSELTETLDGDADLEKKCQEITTEINTTNLSLLDKKLKNTQLSVYRELGKAIKKPDKTTVSIIYKNIIFAREISVTITQEMRIPLGSLKLFFDGKDTITLTAAAAAAVVEPEKYVRNVDLALEYAGRADSIKGEFSLTNLLNLIKK